MNSKLNLVVLRVTDLERSKRFYEALGVALVLEKHGGGPEHYAAADSAAVFELYRCGSAPATSTLRIGFRVSSMAAAMSKLELLDAAVVSRPSASAWGLRAVIVDPDGNLVELVEDSATTIVDI